MSIKRAPLTVPVDMPDGHRADVDFEDALDVARRLDHLGPEEYAETFEKELIKKYPKR